MLDSACPGLRWNKKPNPIALKAPTMDIGAAAAGAVEVDGANGMAMAGAAEVAGASGLETGLGGAPNNGRHCGQNMPQLSWAC